MLEFHLVEPLQLAAPHGAHGLDGEVENHGLLDPLVHAPLAPFGIDRLGRPQRTLVDELHHGANGLAHRLIGEHFALLPGPLHDIFQFFVHNSCFSEFKDRQILHLFRAIPRKECGSERKIPLSLLHRLLRLLYLLVPFGIFSPIFTDSDPATYIAVNQRK